MFSIGLMSGTSMDGIDAALIYTDGLYHIETIANHYLPYNAPQQLLFKAAEYAIRMQQGNLTLASKNFSNLQQEYLNNEGLLNQNLLQKSLEDIIQLSAHLHLLATQQLLEKVPTSISQKIQVIGYHGQAVYHQPQQKISLQLGNPSYLFECLKIPIVFNFRQADILAGGQGAPLAPLYHHALAVRDKLWPLAVVNCGGIANITLMTDTQESILGFDTGPGNILIDRWVRIKTHGNEQMDFNGHYGLSGKVYPEILSLLIEKSVQKNHMNYFELKPPKSLDPSEISLIKELELLALPDACRTLAAFTAESIVQSLKWLKQDSWPKYWVLVGGGWNNQAIFNEFETRLKQLYQSEVIIKYGDDIGWNNSTLEAEIFAYLAVRHLNNLPTSLPSVTGARKAVVGGDCIS